MLPAIETAAEQRSPIVDGAARRPEIDTGAFGGPRQSEDLVPGFAIRENLELIRLDVVALLGVKQEKLFTAATLGAAVTRNRRQSSF
jgi:hypothetical protein